MQGKFDLVIAVCYAETGCTLNNTVQGVGIMKKIRLHVFAIMCFCCLAVVGVAGGSPYQVTFETTDCNGDTGFTTVGVDEIFKIQSAGCSGPDGTPLKQMLVHNGSGSYNAYTMTEEESKNVRKEIKDYMAARRGVLDRSGAIIVKP